MSERAAIDPRTSVEHLVNTAPYFQTAHERLVANWSPDIPPLTIVFSNLGRCFCDHASTTSKETQFEICAAIEYLITRGDDEVKNAIATGMLEAILAESSAERMDMSILANSLGPETKAYCRSWDSFTGNKTQGI